MEADVSATDSNVPGSFPNFIPATALIPICDPIVGFEAILGIMIIPDFFFSLAGALIKSLLIAYLANKVTFEDDKAFNEKGYADTFFEQWKQEHF
jgi:hypothetical protein